MTTGNSRQTALNLFSVLGVVLLLASGLLLFISVTFDATVAGSDGIERIYNTGLLAVKQDILLGAAATFVSSWIALAAGHIRRGLDAIAAVRLSERPVDGP